MSDKERASGSSPKRSPRKQGGARRKSRRGRRRAARDQQRSQSAALAATVPAAGERTTDGDEADDAANLVATGEGAPPPSRRSLGTAKTPDRAGRRCSPLKQHAVVVAPAAAAAEATTEAAGLVVAASLPPPPPPRSSSGRSARRARARRARAGDGTDEAAGTAAAGRCSIADCGVATTPTASDKCKLLAQPLGAADYAALVRQGTLPSWDRPPLPTMAAARSVGGGGGVAPLSPAKRVGLFSDAVDGSGRGRRRRLRRPRALCPSQPMAYAAYSDEEEDGGGSSGDDESGGDGSSSSCDDEEELAARSGQRSADDEEGRRRSSRLQQRRRFRDGAVERARARVQLLTAATAAGDQCEQPLLLVSCGSSPRYPPTPLTFPLAPAAVAAAATKQQQQQQPIAAYASLQMNNNSADRCDSAMSDYDDASAAAAAAARASAQRAGPTPRRLSPAASRSLGSNGDFRAPLTFGSRAYPRGEQSGGEIVVAGEGVIESPTPPCRDYSPPLFTPLPSGGGRSASGSARNQPMLPVSPLWSSGPNDAKLPQQQQNQPKSSRSNTAFIDRTATKLATDPYQSAMSWASSAMMLVLRSAYVTNEGTFHAVPPVVRRPSRGPLSPPGLRGSEQYNDAPPGQRPTTYDQSSRMQRVNEAVATARVRPTASPALCPTRSCGVSPEAWCDVKGDTTAIGKNATAFERNDTNRSPTMIQTPTRVRTPQKRTPSYAPPADTVVGPQRTSGRMPVHSPIAEPLLAAAVGAKALYAALNAAAAEGAIVSKNTTALDPDATRRSTAMAQASVGGRTPCVRTPLYSSPLNAAACSQRATGGMSAQSPVAEPLLAAAMGARALYAAFNAAEAEGAAFGKSAAGLDPNVTDRPSAMAQASTLARRTPPRTSADGTMAWSKCRSEPSPIAEHLLAAAVGAKALYAAAAAAFNVAAGEGSAFLTNIAALDQYDIGRVTNRTDASTAARPARTPPTPEHDVTPPTQPSRIGVPPAVNRGVLNQPDLAGGFDAPGRMEYNAYKPTQPFSATAALAYKRPTFPQAGAGSLITRLPSGARVIGTVNAVTEWEESINRAQGNANPSIAYSPAANATVAPAANAAMANSAAGGVATAHRDGMSSYTSTERPTLYSYQESTLMSHAAAGVGAITCGGSEPTTLRPPSYFISRTHERQSPLEPSPTATATTARFTCHTTKDRQPLMPQGLRTFPRSSALTDSRFASAFTNYSANDKRTTEKKDEVNRRTPDRAAPDGGNAGSALERPLTEPERQVLQSLIERTFANVSGERVKPVSAAAEGTTDSQWRVNAGLATATPPPRRAAGVITAAGSATGRSAAGLPESGRSAEKTGWTAIAADANETKTGEKCWTPGRRFLYDEEWGKLPTPSRRDTFNSDGSAGSGGITSSGPVNAIGEGFVRRDVPVKEDGQRASLAESPYRLEPSPKSGRVIGPSPTPQQIRFVTGDVGVVSGGRGVEGSGASGQLPSEEPRWTGGRNRQSDAHTPPRPFNAVASSDRGSSGSGGGVETRRQRSTHVYSVNSDCEQVRLTRGVELQPSPATAASQARLDYGPPRCAVPLAAPKTAAGVAERPTRQFSPPNEAVRGATPWLASPPDETTTPQRRRPGDDRASESNWRRQKYAMPPTRGEATREFSPPDEAMRGATPRLASPPDETTTPQRRRPGDDPASESDWRRPKYAPPPMRGEATRQFSPPDEAMRGATPRLASPSDETKTPQRRRLGDDPTLELEGRQQKYVPPHLRDKASPTLVAGTQHDGRAARAEAQPPQSQPQRNAAVTVADAAQALPLLRPPGAAQQSQEGRRATAPPERGSTPPGKPSSGGAVAHGVAASTTPSTTATRSTTSTTASAADYARYASAGGSMVTPAAAAAAPSGRGVALALQETIHERTVTSGRDAQRLLGVSANGGAAPRPTPPPDIARRSFEPQEFGCRDHEVARQPVQPPVPASLLRGGQPAASAEPAAASTARPQQQRLMSSESAARPTAASGAAHHPPTLAALPARYSVNADGEGVTVAAAPQAAGKSQVATIDTARRPPLTSPTPLTPSTPPTPLATETPRVHYSQLAAGLQSIVQQYNFVKGYVSERDYSPGEVASSPLGRVMHPSDKVDSATMTAVAVAGPPGRSTRQSGGPAAVVPTSVVPRSAAAAAALTSSTAPQLQSAAAAGTAAAATAKGGQQPTAGAAAAHSATSSAAAAETSPPILLSNCSARPGASDPCGGCAAHARTSAASAPTSAVHDPQQQQQPPPHPAHSRAASQPEKAQSAPQQQPVSVQQHPVSAHQQLVSAQQQPGSEKLQIDGTPKKSRIAAAAAPGQAAAGTSDRSAVVSNQSSTLSSGGHTPHSAVVSQKVAQGPATPGATPERATQPIPLPPPSPSTTASATATSAAAVAPPATPDHDSSSKR